MILKRILKFMLQILLGIIIIFCIFTVMSMIDVHRGFYKQFESPIKGGIER